MTKTKRGDFQAAYNNLMATPDGKYNSGEAKFYLQRIHDETSYSFQKILADAIIIMVRGNDTYRKFHEEWLQSIDAQ